MAKDISEQIRELLFRHDCVIVPGFGAFIGNYFPAHIDRKSGLFEPPSRKITFNRHLTGNDGLLIGHISAVTGRGYAEAREIVREWADDLRKRIMTGTPVPIAYLGTFSLNYDRVIVFDPDLTVNYLLSSYGLSAYHRRPAKGFDVRKRALERRPQPLVSQPSVRSLLARAAVIIPVLAALALVPFNDRIFKSHIDEASLNPLARAELEFNRAQIESERLAGAAPFAIYDEAETPAAEIPAATGAVTTGTATTGAAATGTAATGAAATGTAATGAVGARIAGTNRAVLTDTVTPERAAGVTAATAGRTPAATPQQPARRATAEVVEEYRYMVIIGSFQGEENALTMIEKLRRQGYDPEMSGGPDGYLRVSAQVFKTLDEAKVVLEKFRKEYPGAWVFRSR